ncbi:uncharacterized protein C1orf115 [Nematolebias whitei]|uniref:uncharacterized protein C1orf115 n=1 Tax=Nematolebias whitei TaxID=451745 RepID=UPI001898D817|nr:uncharacterized protein C1orf115 [Nematolebias whitei]
MLTTFLTSSENWQQEDNMKNSSLPSRLFDRNSAAGSGETRSSAKYQRHVDCVDQSQGGDAQTVCADSRSKERWLREINFAFRPDRYEPLMDDEAKGKKKKRKENYKKVKKNVGKALRTTWKCFKLGLHNFALAYSTPITVAAAFAPEFYYDRDKT